MGAENVPLAFESPSSCVPKLIEPTNACGVRSVILMVAMSLSRAIELVADSATPSRLIVAQRRADEARRWHLERATEERRVVDPRPA